ncbi:MAG: pirin family protein [Gammaproteobacteria bacterium]|nr:pirin family protein [Gammaproteobacteria bacterium]
MVTQRLVTRIVHAEHASDGAGVKLNRVIANSQLDHLDPFLLLDEFNTDAPQDYVAGFPEHPHRGFETVTYMLAGRMRHRDNQGNEGLLLAGGAQWMTAGRGILHAEMPEQEAGLLHGFQLWVNLPAATKMGPPRYQDIEPAQIPTVGGGPGVLVRVLAGAFGQAHGPVNGVWTAPHYFDVTLESGCRTSIPVPAQHTAFAYVFAGAASVGNLEVDSTRLRTRSLGVLSEGDVVHLTADDGGARLLVVAGQPIREPIVRYGPFVMNTEAEIHRAFADFHAGRF